MINKLFEKVVDLIWYNPVSLFLRKLGRFLLRLCRWIPVLYEQEEWDAEYIYDILELKLKELYKNIQQDTWHEERGVKRSLLQIKICLERLHRYQNAYEYFDVPECAFEFNEDGTVELLTTKDYDKIIDDLVKFEYKNNKKFWQDLTRWHHNWWT